MRGKIHEAALVAADPEIRAALVAADQKTRGGSCCLAKRQEAAHAASPRDKRGGRWSGGYSGVATPDPIPNSVVKGSCADGTAS